jgi:hypothetical protein
LTLVTNGPRSSLFGQISAALEPKAIAGVQTNGALHRLREVIEQNRTVDEMPEMFCFGLLREFDIPELAALAGR